MLFKFELNLFLLLDEKLIYFYYEKEKFVSLNNNDLC